jgi:hypothetical protein
VAVLRRPRVERLHERAQPQLDAEGPGLVEAVAHVLQHVLQLEERLEVALEHRAALQTQYRGGARAAGGHLEERSGIKARALRGQHRFRECHRVHRSHRVREQLGELGVALRTHVHDALSHDVEQRTRALEVLRRAADHDRERAVLGLRPGAGHGGLEKGHAVVGEPLANLACGGGRDGGHVDRQGAVSEPVQRTLIAEQHLLDLGRVGHHRDHHRRAVGSLARGRRRAGAVLLREALRLLLRARVDG